MTHVRAQGEPSDSRADWPGVAVACLGVLLLAGTALPGLSSSGPPFPTFGVRFAASDHEGGRSTARVRRAAPGPAPAHGRVDMADEPGKPGPPQALDINRAEVAELQALPGVGPTLARRIVGHREVRGPFRKPEDLRQVSGIGATRYARLHGLIRTAEAP